MAKPVPVVALKPATVKPDEVFNPQGSVGHDDFFRLKRSGSGWVVEMVRLKASGVDFRREVWVDDLFPMAERRLTVLASESERNR
jgi:hypothetical protein